MDSELGKIEISPKAIGSLVSHVVMQTYGVAGMSMPTTASNIAATLTRDPRRGVVVEIDAGAGILVIDVYIIVNYGINLASVANSLINAIRYHVGTRIDLNLQQVNIHIQGLRMPSDE